MNKKILIVLIVVFGLLMTGIPLIADSNGTGNSRANALISSANEHGRSIEEVMSDIRKQLGLSKDSSINADKVDNKLLEELGEAVMAYRVPDPKQHEWMDNMMGGEGSENLKAIHRVMGYNYLKYGSVGSFGFGPMMSGGVRGFGNSGFMMGSGYPGRFGSWAGRYNSWIVIAFIIGLLVAVIVLALFLVRRRSFGSTRFGEESSYSLDMDALGILKRSYARGEISREEYLRKRNDLTEE